MKQIHRIPRESPTPMRNPMRRPERNQGTPEDPQWRGQAKPQTNSFSSPAPARTLSANSMHVLESDSERSEIVVICQESEKPLLSLLIELLEPLYAA